jgi:hypothetical protein
MTEAVYAMLDIEQIARLAHEVNRAYCEALGDTTQKPWDEAPLWARDSAIAGVKAHLAMDISPRESHELWCQHKVVEGWSWGITKDPAAKKHPCLVPYDSLPLEQRVKDYLFAGVVRAFKTATTKGGDPSGSKEG